MAARPKVRYATIFVFPGGAKGKVRVNATPETLTVRAGDVVDWTVVNAASDTSPGRVSIAWKEASPLKTEPKDFDRAARATVRAKARAGRYKYSVLLNGEPVFDPEIEVMN